MELLEDLGMRFPTEASKQKRRFGLFKCPECGRTYEMNLHDTISRNTKMCKSCSTTKNKTTHGGRYHKLYGVWTDQRDRCNRSTHKFYDRYGGRGINMSNEFSDFSVWLQYVEALPNAYKDTYTIDRIDNNKGYERGNLRWASKNTQAHNTKLLRSTNKTGFRGVMRTKSGKYSASIGINSKRIHLGTFSTSVEAALAYDTYVYKNCLEHTTNDLLCEDSKKQVGTQKLLENTTKENLAKALNIQRFTKLSEQVLRYKLPEEQLQELEKESVLSQQTLKDIK